LPCDAAVSFQITVAGFIGSDLNVTNGLLMFTNSFSRNTAPGFRSRITRFVLLSGIASSAAVMLG